jgi:hypothetical protein
MTLKAVPNSLERTTARFDIGSSVLSIIGVGCLVLGIYEGPVQGWSALVTLGGLIAGLSASAAFAAWELRCHEPLLDIRAFRSHSLSSGSATLTILLAVLEGVTTLAGGLSTVSPAPTSRTWVTSLGSSRASFRPWQLLRPIARNSCQALP